MFGIAWGIVSITLMVAAGEGLQQGQARTAANFGKDLMILFSGRTSLQAGGTRAGRSLEWMDTDHQLVSDQSPDCKYVLPESGQSNTPVHSSYNNGLFLVVGSLPPFAEIRSIDIAEGRFYNWEDQSEHRRVAFIGSDVKKQLFGERQGILSQTISIGDFPYTIIGVMKAKEQDSSYDGRDVTKIYLPHSRMQIDFPQKPPSKPHAIDQLLVTPRSITQHEACKKEVRTALGKIYNFDPQDKEAAQIWDTVENAKAFAQMTEGMKYFLGAVGLTTLCIGGIGVMNVMLVAVRERTREIGVRKAIGATSRSILWQFFIETLILVFISGGIGMALAYGICALVNMLPMPDFFAGLIPTYTTTLLAIGLLGTVAVLAALYPAHRAASIDPIEALRYEAGG